MYAWISAVNPSPAILIDLLQTIPPRAITAISVVPPPISTTMQPSGASTSRPIPMAAAIGIGLDVEAPEGCMVVDIGGGTTEIAVIALGGIVCNKSLRIAGDGFTADIQAYMRHQHNIKIGERTAEDIKIGVGAALPDID